MAFDLAFDEGGEGSDLLVSMQLGTVDRAKKLKKHWLKGLNGIPHFHSKDFKNIDYGVFTGLSAAQRTHLLSKLCTLIHRHLSLGITSRIDVNLYNSITTNEFRSKWGTAYTFSLNTLSLVAYLYFQQHNLPMDVNILIEDGHRNASQALQNFQEAKKRANDSSGRFLNILTAGLGSKSDHPILQSSDMLAYSTWQQIHNRDMEIFNTLHLRKTAKYTIGGVVITEELIKNITDSATDWEDKSKQFGKRVPKGHEQLQQAIREVRSDDEVPSQDSAQRDQSQAGCGEGGED